jgi:hypothetical protein
MGRLQSSKNHSLRHFLDPQGFIPYQQKRIVMPAKYGLKRRMLIAFNLAVNALTLAYD